MGLVEPLKESKLLKSCQEQKPVPSLLHCKHANFANTMPTIELFLMPKDDLIQVHTKLKIRYALGHTVPKARSYHVFISKNVGILSFKTIGEDEEIRRQCSFFPAHKLLSLQISKTM